MEIWQPQVRKTEYEGILQDKKIQGFWVFILVTLYWERAIPYGFIAYQGDLRNQHYFRALAAFKNLFGECPLVLDWEFN